MGSYRIAVLPGDGIGNEVTRGAIEILKQSKPVLGISLPSNSGLSAERRLIKKARRSQMKRLPSVGKVMRYCSGQSVVRSGIAIPRICARKKGYCKFAKR